MSPTQPSWNSQNAMLLCYTRPHSGYRKKKVSNHDQATSKIKNLPESSPSAP